MKRYVYIIPVLVAAALAFAVFSADDILKQSDRQSRRLAVYHALSSLQSGLENAIGSKVLLLKAVQAYVANNPELTQDEFATLSRALLADTSGVRYLELARNNSISHVYPDTDRDMVLGLRLFEDLPQPFRATARKALDAGQVRLTAPYRLIEGGTAIIALAPVMLPGRDASGLRTHWGFAAVLIDDKALFRQAGLMDASPGLLLGLRGPGNDADDAVLLTGEDVFRMSPVVTNIRIPGGSWQLAAVPRTGWSPSAKRPVFLIVGLFASLLMTGLVWAAIFFVRGRLKAREEYRYLVENAKSVILRIDLEGRITFCNEYASEFFGHRHGSLIGRHIIGTLIPEKTPDGESMKRYINRLLRNPSAHPFNETLCTRKNGELVWVAWANRAVNDADGNMVELLSVGTDITDRRIMEEALRSSARQYRMLAENITDVIWGLDPEFNITYISPSDEQLRGFVRSEVLGRPVFDFMAPVSARAFRAVLEDISAAHPSGRVPARTLDMEMLCRDGATVWVETRVVALRNEFGDLVGVQGVSRDITDRKLAEELREDVERITRHDLKAPLGAVLGLPGEIRQAGPLSAAQDAMLATIEGAGQDMMQLITGSLDLYKMERGTYGLRPAPVDALRVLDRIVNENRAVIRAKGVNVGMDVVTGGDSFPVIAEERLFRSMLANLMLNALTASPEGGTLSVELAQGDDIGITIRNQGEVPADLRETFFDKYSRAPWSHGIGLGTYSARLIARTHGGDIGVDTSVPGETSVTVTLPLMPPSD